MELVERHGILEKGPSELRFVVDVGDLRNGVSLGGCKGTMIRYKGQVSKVTKRTSFGVKFLGELLLLILELLKESGSNREEIYTSKSFDLADL